MGNDQILLDMYFFFLQINTDFDICSKIYAQTETTLWS